MSYTATTEGTPEAGHPLDDLHRLFLVLSGYGTGRAEGSLLQAIRSTSARLTGSGTTGATDHPTGGEVWGPYIRGIGAVALRAVSPVVPRGDREYLLAVLETWAETAFADPAIEVRISEFARDADRTGFAEDQATRLCFARMRDVFATVVEPTTASGETSGQWAWGSAVQLRALVATIRERGPVSWDPEAVRVLADHTGLTRQAAALVLAGCFTRLRVFGDVLDAGQRELVGLTKAELSAAEWELGEFSQDEFGCGTKLITDALPEDPASLWNPDGMRNLAGRLAEVWNARYGRRITLPENTIAAATAVHQELNIPRIGVGVSVARLSAMVADPDTAPELTATLRSSLEKHRDHPRYWVRDASGPGSEFTWRWQSLIQTCRWGYAFLPAGDPVRSGIPRTIELLRAQLRQPEFLLDVGNVAQRTIDSVRDRRPADCLREDSSFDDGLIVAAGPEENGEWTLALRPANYLRDDRSVDLRAMVMSYRRDDLDYLDWLLGDECDRMVARITADPIPAGRFETDPGCSDPELVAEVAAELEITADAAVLYLQLATLIAPTDRNIRTWNGWRPARHRAAENELLARRLVIPDKRGRAGRSVFLPGTWIDKPGIEAWKWELHGLRQRYREKFARGTSTPSRTLPELFRAAWAQVRAASTSADAVAIDAFGAVDPVSEQASQIAELAAVAPVPAIGDATAVDPHPLDDYVPLSRAVQGYDSGAADLKVLRAIRITSNLLRGEALPDIADNWPHLDGNLVWNSCIHGVGSLALRAIGAATPPAARPYLLALLEVWAETIFADPTVELRTGWGEVTLPLVATHTGIAVALSTPGKSSCRFVDVRHGESEPPALGRIDRVTPVGPRWGDRDQLLTLIELVRTRGPVPWDASAATVFATRTGMSPAASALIIAGYFDWFQQAKDPYEHTRRDILGLTALTATDAGHELDSRRHRDARGDAAVFGCALPDDPAELWEPGGMSALAERAADAWIGVHGPRTTIPPAALTAAAPLRLEFTYYDHGPAVADLCAVLIDPNGWRPLTDPACHRLQRVGDGYRTSDHSDWGSYDFDRRLSALVRMSRWAYAFRPAGDPMRSGVHRTLELLRDRLRDPDRIVYLGSENSRDIADFSAISGVAPVVDAEGGRWYDDGLVVASTDGGRDSWRVSYRPAHYGSTVQSDLLRTRHGGRFRIGFAPLDWLFGPDCTRILDRLDAADLPTGRYETDPTLSAPGVIDDVMTDLGLDLDAATLYLQLLTLLRPADRQIRTWNRWKAERHKEIEEELLARKLVVRDERKRAGRTLFIPGRWVGKPGMEEWKLPLYDLVAGYRGSVEDPGVNTPGRALPDLYRAAWQRVRDGDVPS
ncbi:hypothetical protein [Nocardia sp. NBC_00511]|uniref:hypothetical protein n=1 Tax=Nocardia sp. NBC_00511 TaxID=2903591 RepID=UPI0030E35F64